MSTSTETPPPPPLPTEAIDAPPVEEGAVEAIVAPDIPEETEAAQASDTAPKPTAPVQTDEEMMIARTTFTYTLTALLFLNNPTHCKACGIPTTTSVQQINRVLEPTLDEESAQDMRRSTAKRAMELMHQGVVGKPIACTNGCGTIILCSNCKKKPSADTFMAIALHDMVVCPNTHNDAMVERLLTAVTRIGGTKKDMELPPVTGLETTPQMTSPPDWFNLIAGILVFMWAEFPKNSPWTAFFEPIRVMCKKHEQVRVSETEHERSQRRYPHRAARLGPITRYVRMLRMSRRVGMSEPVVVATDVQGLSAPFAFVNPSPTRIPQLLFLEACEYALHIVEPSVTPFPFDVIDGLFIPPLDVHNIPVEMFSQSRLLVTDTGRMTFVPPRGVRALNEAEISAAANQPADAPIDLPTAQFDDAITRPMVWFRPAGSEIQAVREASVNAHPDARINELYETDYPMLKLDRMPKGRAMLKEESAKKKQIALKEKEPMSEADAASAKKTEEDLKELEELEEASAPDWNGALHMMCGNMQREFGTLSTEDRMTKCMIVAKTLVNGFATQNMPERDIAMWVRCDLVWMSLYLTTRTFMRNVWPVIRYECVAEPPQTIYPMIIMAQKLIMFCEMALTAMADNAIMGGHPARMTYLTARAEVAIMRHVLETTSNRETETNQTDIEAVQHMHEWYSATNGDRVFRGDVTRAIVCHSLIHTAAPAAPTGAPAGDGAVPPPAV